MNLRAAIIDFDCTLTTQDMLDLLAKKVGKEKESIELNRLFLEGKLDGLTGLIQRINFLRGLTKQNLKEIIAPENYLRPGAKELFEYLKNKNIVTIIASGNIVPLLEIYQSMLGADYVVGSRPKMKDSKIYSISLEDYSGLGFKTKDTKTLLQQLDIPSTTVIAIGDSFADKPLFDFAGVSIAINPKAGIEEHVDYVVRDDLAAVIPIIEKLM